MSFLDRVLKHPDLPFATDDEENLYNLKKEFAVSAKTHAKMSKSQLSEAHKEKICKKATILHLFVILHKQISNT